MAPTQEEHDELLAKKPEGAEHDESNCVFCNTNKTSPQGGVMKTYTEEDLTSAVNEAVAPLAAELATLRAEKTQETIDAQIAEAVAAAEAAVTEIQNKLDAAELSVANATQERDAIVEWLKAETAAEEAAALVAVLREERKAAVKEVATSFTDEQIEAKLDRWVAMDEAAFEDFLDVLRAAPAPVAKTEEATLSSVPAETAMSHTRSTQSGSSSAVGDLFGLLKANVDPRTLS